MKVNNKYLTLLTNLLLTFLSAMIAYFTNWYIIIPVLFGLGIPIVNIRETLQKKLSKIFVIIVVTSALYIGAIIATLNAFFNKYLYAGLVVGIAGLAFLAINALLVKNVKLSKRSAITTTLLAGISLPVWIYLTENTIIDKMWNHEFVRQFGAMILWMIAVTIGISTGIKTISIKE